MDIFPGVPVTISPREAIHDVAQQRVYEWRAAIARAALDAVARFLQTYLATSQARADYIQYALGPGLPFRYASVKTLVDSRETKNIGPFQSAYILETLAYDFAVTGRTVEKSRDFPYSALTLSVVAVERALQRWTTGEYIKPASSDKEAKKKDAFSQEARAESTRSYLRAIANLRETTWIQIMQGAEDRAAADAAHDMDDMGLLEDDGLQDERAVVDESDDDEE
ncbi:hypothetical protein BV20DRAFT_128621 [Pilatotrama ljubarskyi]|nr:hypothetical protein BV20DRAFT_128621 [Pilatotrama ljubarskyi]